MSLLISLLFLTVVYLTPLHAAESRGSFEGVEILPSGLETVEESIDFWTREKLLSATPRDSIAPREDFSKPPISPPRPVLNGEKYEPAEAVFVTDPVMPKESRGSFSQGVKVPITSGRIF